MVALGLVTMPLHSLGRGSGGGVSSQDREYLEGREAFHPKMT